MKQLKTHIPARTHSAHSITKALKGTLIAPLSWLSAAAHGTPGARLQLIISLLLTVSLFRARPRHALSAGQLYRMILSPMESARYFEFDFFWKRIKIKPRLGRYLDVSSPRLFTGLLLRGFKSLHAHMVNPDLKDLLVSKKLFHDWGIDSRCRFHPLRVDEMPFPSNFFDTIVSISVIEHLPGNDDTRAIAKLWDLLRPNGSLYLSVPCAKEAFEEYIDYNEYGILASSKDGFVFGQRFYDERALKNRIFFHSGEPIHFAVFGEIRNGVFFENRARKLSDPNYPFWSEPTFVRKNFRYFDSISEMPGLGVIAMEFAKP
jgi:SAM-dependent methyltransferase